MLPWCVLHWRLRCHWCIPLAPIQPPSLARSSAISNTVAIQLLRYHLQRTAYYILYNSKYVYIYIMCVCASYIFSQGFQGACPISYMNAQIVTTSPHTSTYCISLTFTARRIFRELKPKAALIKPELGIQLALPQGWRLPKVVLFWSDLPSRRPKPGAGDLRWPCWQSTLQVGNQLLFNSVL